MYKNPLNVIKEIRPYATITWSGNGGPQEMTETVLLLPDLVCPRCHSAAVEVHCGGTAWYDAGCRTYLSTYVVSCAKCKRRSQEVRFTGDLNEDGIQPMALGMAVENWEGQTPGESYLAMEREILTRRSAGTITEDEDDELTERMTEVWWRMGEEEKSEARDRAKVLAEKGLTPSTNSGSR